MGGGIVEGVGVGWWVCFINKISGNILSITFLSNVTSGLRDTNGFILQHKKRYYYHKRFIEAGCHPPKELGYLYKYISCTSFTMLIMNTIMVTQVFYALY